MRAWWGSLSLRARLAVAFGAMAAGALVFLLAIVARTLGAEALTQGKILPAAGFAFAVFFVGGWFVAAWCLREIGRLAARASSAFPGGAGVGRQWGESPPPPARIPMELEGLAALLRREAERRDQLLCELQRFTANAAHELRTPLTALRTTGEVALRQASLGRASDGDTLREALETVLEEAQRMSVLLERLLRLARLESEVVRLRPVSLAEHLANWREALRVLEEEKQLAVQIDCPAADGGAALRVVTDPALLGHAVTNVLHNAIQYSPLGGRVGVSVRVEAGAIAIAISDEGPGIAAEDQGRIFERFYRGGGAKGRGASGTPQGGSGLGLCIAKAAVERLGGRLSLRSGVSRPAALRPATDEAAAAHAAVGGSGAEFTIWLPRS